MRQVILYNDEKYYQVEYSRESEFENRLRSNSTSIFGEKTIFLDVKNLVSTRSLGGTIPDGFLFDFRDEENPEFYLIEVELEKHDFYRHIFPQLTKFFAFFRNQQQVNDLVKTLDTYINTNPAVKAKFSSHLKGKELYKALKETLENSQNILLIIDGEKPEFKEMMETYTDTWGRKLNVMIVKEFQHDDQSIFLVSPDYEQVDLGEISERDTPESVSYTEEFHLSEVNENVKEIYNEIKNWILEEHPNVKVNPQKYYISLREKRNFTYIKPRKTRMNIVIMTPLEEGREVIRSHVLSELGEGVQRFYNGPCYRVTIFTLENMEEIHAAIELAYKRAN